MKIQHKWQTCPFPFLYIVLCAHCVHIWCILCANYIFHLLPICAHCTFPHLFSRTMKFVICPSQDQLCFLHVNNVSESLSNNFVQKGFPTAGFMKIIKIKSRVSWDFYQIPCFPGWSFDQIQISQSWRCCFAIPWKCLLCTVLYFVWKCHLCTVLYFVWKCHLCTVFTLFENAIFVQFLLC